MAIKISAKEAFDIAKPIVEVADMNTLETIFDKLNTEIDIEAKAGRFQFYFETTLCYYPFYWEKGRLYRNSDINRVTRIMQYIREELEINGYNVEEIVDCRDFYMIRLHISWTEVDDVPTTGV